jgi:hypothetical protein
VAMNALRHGLRSAETVAFRKATAGTIRRLRAISKTLGTQGAATKR